MKTSNTKTTVRLALLAVGMVMTMPTQAADIVHYVCPEPEIYYHGGSFDKVHTQPLDLNGDGIIDFRIVNHSPGLEMSCYLSATNSNEILTQGGLLSPLPVGALIGPQPEQGAWTSTEAMISRIVNNFAHLPPEDLWQLAHGIWFGKDAYAGVKFYAGGQPYYGWIHIRHETLASALTVIDWAYATQPGAPVYAGTISEVAVASKVVRPGYLRLQWPSLEAYTYQVQAATNAVAPRWDSLGFLLPGTGTNVLLDLPLDKQEKYYRVLQLK